MSLYLGPEAYEAIQRMKNTPEWRAFVTGLETLMQQLMHRALEAEDRADAGGYARGLRDLVAHIEQIETGNRQAKPAVKARAPEVARV